MVWATTKWGGLLGALFGVAVVWWVAAAIEDLSSDDAEWVLAFSAIAAVVGFFAGLLLGVLAGTVAHVIVRQGGDRAAASVAAGAVVAVLLVLLTEAVGELLVPALVAGVLAGGAVWHVQRDHPGPRPTTRDVPPPAEPRSDGVRWGDPPAPE